MLRKVSINWYKQRSGSFALKGITITEDNRSYDSSTTFRDEDAEWVTASLGAEPNVELTRTRDGEFTMDGYPRWAENKRDAAVVDIEPIALERANATLMRYFLTQIIETTRASSATGSYTDEDRIQFLKLIHDSDALLHSTDCGTHYSVEDALDILTRSRKKPYATKPERAADTLKPQ